MAASHRAGRTGYPVECRRQAPAAGAGSAIIRSRRLETQETPGSRDNDDPAEASQETASETPAMSRTEKLFVRVSVWQTVLSVAGVFIGVVALYAALTESEAARKQTAATVWPYLQLEVSDYANESGAGFSIAFSNAGVGPARVRAMQLRIAGRRSATGRLPLRASSRKTPRSRISAATSSSAAC